MFIIILIIYFVELFYIEQKKYFIKKLVKFQYIVHFKTTKTGLTRASLVLDISLS